MQLTAEELKLLKKHCKIDHNSEDDLLGIYYSWAFHEIASAVTDEPSKYILIGLKVILYLLVLYTL